MIETTTERFEHDVLIASRTKPILVDFWAPWCGPCRVIGPVLEALERKAQGAWTLVKVNTDEAYEVAGTYRISSIPAVKLFRDGRVVGEFVGALPESQIQQFLDAHLPKPGDDLLSEALAARDQGRFQDARKMLEHLMEKAPTHQEAKLILAELSLASDPERAKQLVGELDDGALTERIERLRWLLDVLARIGRLESASRAIDDYRLGLTALGQNQFDKAAEHLLAVVRTDRRLDEDGGRRALLVLFDILGPQHSVTRDARQALSRLLY